MGAWRRLLRTVTTDGVLVAALFAVAALVGSVYERTFDSTGARAVSDLRMLPTRSMWYQQSDFGPAVALACGRGYRNPGLTRTPALTDFLMLKADRFSCAELPASLPQGDLTFFQRLYRYLLTATAAVWAVRGVSWSGLWPLFGLLYGITAVVCYGLFRLGMGRAVSCIAALMLVMSPIQLGNLPGLRDYAKAPFILGLILVVVHLARRVDRSRAFLALSALFGAVLGVGFGFRNDIVIVIPLFLIAVLAWDPPRNVRTLGIRIAGIALAAMTFVAVAFPILTGYARGTNSGHATLAGVMSPFDQPLGITPSVYSWGYAFSDALEDVMIESYTERVHGRAADYLSPEYDRAAVEYLLLVARHWPADIAARAYGAVLRIVELPFAPGTIADPIPYGVQSPALLRLYGWYNALAGVMRGEGVFLVAIALLVISRAQLWAAVLLLVALLYITGYPSLQFLARHFFHLEFIAWWALAFLAERSAAGIVAYARARRGGSRPAVSPADVRSVAAFALIALALIALPLLIARWYQERHLRTFLAAYVDAPRDPLPAVPVESDDHTMLRTSTLWRDSDARLSVNTQYIVARFSPATCPVVRLPVMFRYSTLHGEADLSLETTIMFLPPSPVVFFFPAYHVRDKFTFEGIQVARGLEGCVEDISRVRNLAALPMLLNLKLTPDWRQATLYQRLSDWEVPNRAPVLSFYTLPSALTVMRSTLSTDVQPPEVWKTPIVRDPSLEGWSIAGTSRGPEWPAVEFAAQPRTPNDRFVLEGEVIRGGITVGLVRDHQWTEDGHLAIARQGRFVAILAPSVAGEYGILCVNGLSRSWFLRHAPARLVRFTSRFHDFNDVRISKAGWARLQ